MLRVPFSVLYVTDPSDKDSWKDLTSIRKELGGGDWHSSKIFEEVGVASEHNITPSEFWAMSEVDRAYLIAYERTKSTMTSWSQHVAEKASKKR